VAQAPARKRALALLVLVGLGSGVAPSSLARAADPRVAWRASAAPGGNGAGELVRLGAENRSALRLPATPSVSFQLRLAPPVIGDPTSIQDGRVLVAHGTDHLTALDGNGKTLWSIRVGADLASGPIAVERGGALVLTRDGRLLELGPGGAVHERERLPWPTVDGPVIATPAGDGGVILAAGTRLARIGPRGARGFQTKLPSPVRAVFAWRGATLAVGRDGSVWLRGGAGAARDFARFGAPVGRALLRGDRLFGLSEHGLASVDLATKQRSLLFSDASQELHDLALTRDGKLVVAAGRATLVELDDRGHELTRVALPTAENGVELTSVVLDDGGTRYVGASGAPLLVVTPQGDASVVPGTGCPDPLRLAPATDGRVLTACRSGLLRGLSDRAP
jgi:hypothetical protein